MNIIKTNIINNSDTIPYPPFLLRNVTRTFNYPNYVQKFFMEIPKRLVELYKHWDFHTKKPQYLEADLNNEIYNRIIKFSNERMSVYENKELGNKPPFSDDPILNNFRFCNIYRELDRQTIFYQELLKPFTNNFPLWLLNMFFCRLICNTETIYKIGLLSFDHQNNRKVYEKLMNLPSPKYGNAYIFPISTIQRFEYNTREKFFCLHLPKIMKKVSNVIEGFKRESVVNAIDAIVPVFGFNLKFHLTELLIDVAYQYPQYIDLYKEFPIGPGSIPTMKMLNNNMNPQKVCLNLVHSVPKNFNYLTLNGEHIYLSAENWEGIGCEYRKYKSLLNGNGRKRRYIDK